MKQENLDQRENRAHKVTREHQETREMLVTLANLELKAKLVTRGIQVIEDQRVPVGSLALRGLLVVLDHVACRGTEELQDLVAPRDQRVKNQVINTSDKCACALCRSSWPSWLPV